MAHVRWEDRVTSEEVRKRCGVKDIIEVLKRSRLRWYGHVRRREEDHILRRAAEMEVEGVRPRGRPKKTWQVPEAGDFGGAFGAARLALMAATGGGAELAAPPPIARVVEPVPALAEAFAAAQDRYRQTYSALRELS